jgi:hypothetical protein
MNLELDEIRKASELLYKALNHMLRGGIPV